MQLHKSPININSFLVKHPREVLTVPPIFHKRKHRPELCVPQKLLFVGGSVVPTDVTPKVQVVVPCAMKHVQNSSLHPEVSSLLVSHPAGEHQVFWREVYEIVSDHAVDCTRHYQRVGAPRFRVIVEVAVVVVCVLAIPNDVISPARIGPRP